MAARSRAARSPRGLVEELAPLFGEIARFEGEFRRPVFYFEATADAYAGMSEADAQRWNDQRDADWHEAHESRRAVMADLARCKRDDERRRSEGER